MPTTTMTLRLSTDASQKLDRLASHTRRTRSFLAGEAIRAYVERELTIVEGIERGLADMKAGRLVPHDEAMDELDRAIDAAEPHA